MKTNFTTSPWEIVTFEENYKNRYAIYPVKGNQDEAIAELFASNNSEKNAHLISAAPEMYEVLNDVLQTIRHHFVNYEIETIEKVLKKARGES